MKFKTTVTPVALLVAGSFGSAANATTVVTDYHPTDAGTPITLEGASSPQFTFINDYYFTAPKAYLQGNDGAMVSTPSAPSSYSSGAYTSSFIFDGDGNYGITFSANGTQYHGFATVTDMGQTISQISYDVGGVPEPATWAMMVLGLGLAGGALRRSKRRQAALATA